MSKNVLMGAQPSNSEESRVGIFWLVGGGRLIIDSAPISQAEPYANALAHPRSHVDVWQDLQKRNFVDADTEYEELPRGRVGYDVRAKRFFLFADRCILAKPTTVRKIMSAMNLPPGATDSATDSHYRCARCLLKYPVT